MRHRAGRWAVVATGLAGVLACSRPGAFLQLGAGTPAGPWRRGLRVVTRRGASPWQLDTPADDVKASEIRAEDDAKASKIRGEDDAKADQGEQADEEDEEDISDILAPEKIRVPVEELEVGQTLEGVVDGRWKQLGVFVDVHAEKNGLLRVTEMTEGFPGDRIMMKKGDKVTVRVLDKSDRGRFSLTMRPGELPRPAAGISEGDPATFLSFLVPDWFDAEVDHIVTWGAFVKVWPAGGQDPIIGLLHKSRFKEGFAEEIAIGSKLKVRVVAADAIKGRIDLSMLEH